MVTHPLVTVIALDVPVRVVLTVHTQEACTVVVMMVGAISIAKEEQWAGIQTLKRFVRIATPVLAEAVRLETMESLKMARSYIAASMLTTVTCSVKEKQ
ncbi:MAG TPA: hypothetical protein VFK47_17655 [Ktedonobacteraceae bacterium]|nr:hypothetical protein [Ktedonobacteraceae bacterium]